LMPSMLVAKIDGGEVIYFRGSELNRFEIEESPAHKWQAKNAEEGEKTKTHFEISYQILQIFP
jgi:hypothetical protein